MKKFLAFCLAVTLCFCFTSSVVFASESDLSSKASTYSSLWDDLRADGDLFVGSDGLIHIDDDSALTKVRGYDDFFDLIETCNYAILNGLLVVDAETLELTTTYEVDMEQLQSDINSYAESGIDARQIAPSVTRNGAHGCSVQALDLLTMCGNNYEELEDFYYDMIMLSIWSPDINPWATTVGFWVGKVMEGGDWDYKVQPGFSPYDTEFCCLFDGSFNHVTSEYIGNFNFGYTGSYLFSLDVLHFGSSAVAGFDASDQEDWPAIDAGYNNAS